MGQRGGVRPNSGRKSKADEIKLIEQMDCILAPEEAWEALAKLVRSGDGMAVKTWLSYRFGMPKQAIDLTTDGQRLNEITVKVKRPDGTGT